MYSVCVCGRGEGQHRRLRKAGAIVLLNPHPTVEIRSTEAVGLKRNGTCERGNNRTLLLLYTQDDDFGGREK